MSAIRLLPATLMLAACGQPPAARQDLDSLDRELTAAANGSERDPALSAALRDQIMVDPALTQSANANVVRPPGRPDPLSVPVDPTAGRADGVTAGDLKPAPAARRDCPACRSAAGALTLGELAIRQSGGSRCGGAIAYSALWATRLPADVPLYPDARVREAAGDASCGLRVVSFASSAPVGRIIEWYNARVTRAGYTAEHEAEGAMHVLGGTRGASAYIVYATRDPAGGSHVDLLVR